MGAVLTESLSTAPAPVAPGTASGGSHHRARPAIIQGGMGVAVSGWRLAREVSRTGHLGVVSGTAMDAVLARRLQDGDPGGHYRRALVHFPSPAIVERVLEKYYVDGGRAEDAPYKPIPKLTVGASSRRPGARRPRQLRRGVAGEGGPCRRRRHQLPREGPDGDPDRRPRGDARGGRLRAHGCRHPARGPPAPPVPRGRRGRADPRRRRGRNPASAPWRSTRRPCSVRTCRRSPDPTSSRSSPSTSSRRTSIATQRSVPTASSSSGPRPAGTPPRPAAGCSSTSTGTRSTAHGTRPT